MTQNLTLAIIGCGMIGTVHANVVNAHPSLSVAALVDIDDNAAHKLADRIEQEHGAARPAIFRTLEDALAATDIDVVAVCTPSGVHVSNATAALNADKHLIVEKPLDVSVEQGVALEALAVAARERGVTSTVISQHRFDPEAIAVHNAVSAGRFGRLTSAVASIAWWRSQGYYDSGAWRGTWAMDGGGALMNQGVHTVDLLLWMMGRPVEISAMTGLIAHERIEVEDTTAAIIRFESGALATLHATTAAYPNVTNRLQIHGDQGSAVIDLDRLAYFHAADAAEPNTSFMGIPFGHGNQADTELPVNDRSHENALGLLPGHLRQYNDIYDAITGQHAPAVLVEDALLALTTVRAVYISSTLRQPVLLADVLSGAYDNITPVIGS